MGTFGTIPDHMGPHGDIRDHTGPHGDIGGQTWLYAVITGPYGNIRGHRGPDMGSYWTIQGNSGPYTPYHRGVYWAIRCHTVPYGAIKDHTGQSRAIWGHTGPYWTTHGQIGPKLSPDLDIYQNCIAFFSSVKILVSKS